MNHLLVLVLIAIGFCMSSCGDRALPEHTHDASSSTTPPTVNRPSPESLQRLLRQQLDRMRNRVSTTVARIQAQQPNNHIRRECLLWHIRTGDVCLDLENQSNMLIALVQTWYWSVAMERFTSVGEGHTLFDTFQPDVAATTMALRRETESLAEQFLDPKPFSALKNDIEKSVGNGDVFTATPLDRNNALQSVLSATRLESLYNIVLLPFDFLGGVGKGAAALEDLNRTAQQTANRAVMLAERYPQMLSLHLQLAAIEMQEQDASKAVLKDIHTITNTGVQLGDSLRTLPEELRRQAQVLLESSGPAQADARNTLEHVRDAGASLEKAAIAIDNGLKTLDAFIATANQPTKNPTATAEVSPPFSIQDYTKSFAQAESLSRELRSLLELTKTTLTDPQTEHKMSVLIDGRLAATRQEIEQLLTRTHHDADQLLIDAHTQAAQLLSQAHEHIDQSVDHAAWRCLQLALGVAIIVIISFFIIRYKRTST